MDVLDRAIMYIASIQRLRFVRGGPVAGLGRDADEYAIQL
jgi:hypothetical protein